MEREITEILITESVFVDVEPFRVNDNGEIIIVYLTKGEDCEFEKLPIKDYLKKYHGNHRVFQTIFDFRNNLVHFLYYMVSEESK